MPKVFVADKLAPEGIAALESYPELDIDFTPGLDVAEASTHAADADAIIVRSATSTADRPGNRPSMAMTRHSGIDTLKRLS